MGNGVAKCLKAYAATRAFTGSSLVMGSNSLQAVTVSGESGHYPSPGHGRNL